METIQSCANSAQSNESSKGKSILPTCHDRNPLGIMENGVDGDCITSKNVPRTDVDPYKELELYLAKVNDEIGEIIESVPSTLKAIPSYEGEHSDSIMIEDGKNSPSRCENGDKNLCREESETSLNNESLNDWSDNILANFNSIIANEISELTRAKKITKIEESKRLYRDLLNDLGILNIYSTDQEKYSDKQKTLIEILKQEDVNAETDQMIQFLDSDYAEPRDQLYSQRKIPNSISESLNSSTNLTSDYDEPSPCVRSKSINKPLLTKHNSSSLPNGFNACSTLPKNGVEPRNNIEPIPKPSTDPMPRSRRMLRALVRMKNEQKNPKNKLPPRPQETRGEPYNSYESINSQDRIMRNNDPRSIHQHSRNGIEPDYEEIFEPHHYEIIGRSRSLENNMQKSTPTTPTEVKRSPFSKLLRKHKYFTSRKDHSSDAIVLNTASLPKQDIVRSMGREHDKRKGVIFPKVAKDSEMGRKGKFESPTTSRSIITAKRLAESDVNTMQTSPVGIRNSHSDEWRRRGNIASYGSGEMETSEVDGNVIVVDVHRTQDGCDAQDKRFHDDSLSSKSSSMPASLHTLLSRLTKSKGSCYPSSLQMNRLACSEMATQTSPAISRSSSFTWVSDCDIPRQEFRSLQDGMVFDAASPQNTVDDDNRSSSSSQDLLQSMDEISSGSLSPDAIDRSSPLESGIGTASPPRSTDCRSTKALTPPKVPYTSAAKQCSHRKETWDQIRRASSNSHLIRPKNEDDSNVWVRRESVHTQTRAEELEYSPERVDSSSGFDDSLPRPRTLRPHNLPLGSSTVAGNSFSSEELLSSALAARPLASPSAASLQLKTSEPLPVELASKSTSAPMLDNNVNCPVNSINRQRNRHQPRSQSERQLSEIEAQEACKWLRAAGFPQYAQMYEDLQFPIDVTSVAKDHPFLDADSLQSLFRRLHALNRCANMKLDTHHHHHSHHNTSHPKSGGGGGRSGGGEDSDEDAQCALSENWTFEKKTRRWSRVCDIGTANVERLQALAGQHQQPGNRLDSSLEEPCSTLELDETDDAMLESLRYSTLPPGMALPTAAPEEMSPRFRRTGSERLRDGAKAFLRRMESLKSRRRKAQPQQPQARSDGPVVISGPQVVDSASMQRKMRDLNCVDVSPTEGVPPITFAELQQLQAGGGGGAGQAAGSLGQSGAVAGGLSGHQSPFGDDSSSYCSDGSLGGGTPSGCSPSPAPSLSKSKMSRARRLLHRGLREDQGALSDSECQPTSWRHRYFKDANSNNAKVLEFVTSSPRESPLRMRSNAITAIPGRGGSLNLGKESQVFRDKFSSRSHKEDKLSALRREERLGKSVRRKSGDRDQQQRGADSSPARGAAAMGGSTGQTSIANPTATKEVVTVYRSSDKSTHRRRNAIDQQRQAACSQESSSTTTTPSRDSDPEEDSPRHKGNVVRWHSFQRGSLYPEPLDPLCPRAMASMSCGQLLVLRKLALLKLTACMERYCPTHRTGWNWELPKFIRKIKTPPDYKDKTVFGVPLVLSLQRTGQALPKCIQTALRWLRANALDQVGIFRKSGVRSRIQKLKAMTETQGDGINFDGQQAFDVADLVKQYFRELPEALLTNKLSETFIAIFQHVPADLRPDAVQCALLLLPDEHREALETLLDFLSHVASNSPYNQMTASNLAVCLAPSLFHFSHASSPGGAGSAGSAGGGAGGVSGGPGGVSSNRSNSVSPRRRKTVGIPDQRELSENKAAHDCLLYLIKAHRELFMVSSDMLTQCHFNYMEESIPVPLEELGSELKQDWRGYLHACTTALLKEGREKSRGWVSVNNPADVSVEMAYKKVGDGHPLRLWRVTTEVEAPPEELLHRVLRERHVWDPQLLKYRQVARLEANAEVFQYATGNMSPLPARDYCVLRSWQSELPKKACVIVETSVEHPDAPVMLGGTRGIVLASRYLIEHCGSGKSRIMHLSRVDTKGRTPEWYNKSYGHIAALHLSKIRNSFKHMTEGPESKV